MTYSSVDELPSEVRRAFSREDALKWLEEYNKEFDAVPLDPEAPFTESPQFIAREKAWESCKNLPSSRYIMSVVSTEIVDKDGDIADVDGYVSEGQVFVNLGGQVARNHSNKTIGTVWKVYKATDSNTGKPCVVACMNFFRGKPTYDRAWNDYKSRRLEWSIGSIVQAKRECNSNACYNRLYPEQWFELSLVDYARNPMTYNIESNETAKGEEDRNLEMHDEECPILKKYNAFKQHMHEHGLETHIVEGGAIMVIGHLDDHAREHISEEYPDLYMHEEKEEDGTEVSLLIPHTVNSLDDFLEDMVGLIRDEQEAITAYHTVTKSLAQGHFIDEEELEKVKSAFDEVIRDEENHIGVILSVIKIVQPEVYSSIAEGMAEVESDKGCPAGQHEHAGVVGCHDIFRKHSIDYKTNPMDKLDLTDENIDVNAIKNTPTPKLREVVVRIAKVLSTYDKDAVKEFMSHTPGKEFVLAYLELKRRQAQEGDDGMSESNKESLPAPAEAGEQKDSEKGLLADPQTSIATIASTLASMVPLLDGINARLLRVETALAEKTENNTDITSAILSDSSIQEEEKAPAGPAGEAVPGAEAKDEPAIPEASNAEADAEEKTEDKPPFEKKEETTEVEEKKEDGETETEKKEEVTEKEDKSDGGESEKKEKKEDSDKKEPPKKKDDEAKKGSEEEPVATEVAPAPAEEVKGEEAPAPAPAPVEEVKGEEPAPAVEEKGKIPEPEVPAEEVKGEEPAPAESVPVEAEKCDSAKAEPAPVEPEAKGEAAPVVAPAETHVPEMELPTPPGGNVIDFRSAILKRQDELKAKGVNYNVSAGNYSLAQEPATIQTSQPGVSLIEPVNTPTFSGEAIKSTPRMNEMWKNMGKYDSETFLSMMIGQ